MKLGRPELEHIEYNPKFKREYKTDYIHGSMTVTWNYDLNKYERGPISVDLAYPKDYDLPEKQKIDSSRYVSEPVVMVYKTSERSNAKYKLKTWSNKNMDQILRGKGIGVPDDVIILELGVGSGLINDFKNKYKEFLKN